MQISYEDEAYESFQTVLSTMAGYGVTVTTEDGEVIEGVLVGPDPDSDWGSQVLIHPVADGDYLALEAYTTAPRSVDAEDVHVH